MGADGQVPPWLVPGKSCDFCRAMLDIKMPSSTFHSHQQVASLSIDHTNDGIWRKTTLVRQTSQTSLCFSYMAKLVHLSGKEDIYQLQGSKLGSYIRATNLSSINVAIWAIKIFKIQVHSISHQVILPELRMVWWKCVKRPEGWRE